ncbi:glycoside hydrolase family 13 protein [Salisaeta longa]|uniref:glycoside hydrolase family 13 protein n=1 Tax=Salisaeta longa TaxID=503170 RepID=UPI00041D1C2B|nr:glycoside hydrolase family 13 protein [Salisaeta longa]
MRAVLLAVLVSLGVVGCQPTTPPPSTPSPDPVPAWVRDAVFYQIFPERFRNGDPSNDPTRATLERPLSDVPSTWTVTPWTRNWYEEAAWEQAMPGGFYESVYDRRYGGDLQGVIDRLPYLDSLGVTALYFNPVFWARSLHKYDGRTFHHIDPHFGPTPARDKRLIAQETPTDPTTWRMTGADSLFVALLRAAHRRGLRVIIDGVFNHTGRDFFAFNSVQAEQRDAPYADWYDVTAFDDPATPDTNEFAYVGWWDLASLPEFANNPAGTDLQAEVKRYIFDSTRRWMDPNGDGDPSDGVDGWRLDVAPEVPAGFWRDWNAHVRSINPAAYTVAEDWAAASGFLAEGGFSATMNYHGFAYPVKGFLIDNAIGPTAFVEQLAARRTAYTKARRYALLNLIDSHDTPRLASMVANRSDTGYVKPARFDYDWGAVASVRQNRSYDVTAPEPTGRRVQRLVALFQMTYVGAPMIYYGTEAGMWGADDPDDRKPMVWPDMQYEPEVNHPFGQPRERNAVAFNADLHSFYQDLVGLRTAYPALRRGPFTPLYTNDAQRTLAYGRTYEGSVVVVALNRSSEAHSLRIPLPDTLRGTYALAFAVPGDGFRVQQDGAALLLEVPAYGGLIVRRTR